MAVSNYSELKTAVENWAARSDTDFTSRVDDFIDSAEDRIHYGADDAQFPSPPLRILGMETTADLTVSSATVAVPTGWLESIRLYLSTSPKTTVQYVTPSRFYESDIAAVATTGLPLIYTIEGTNIIFAPTPDTTYTGKLSYFKKLDALSASATTNWLITNSPMTYLYAAMIEYGVWAMDDNTALKFLKLYSGKIQSLMSQDQRSRVSGSFLRVLPDVNP